MPDWMRQILHDELDRLAAQEQLRAITAATAPWMKRDAFCRLVRRLTRLSEIDTGPEIIYVSPERAAWFERNEIPYEILPPEPGLNKHGDARPDGIRVPLKMET